jgi:hypothetical protein
VTRKIRIEMPAGSYDLAGASVRFFGDQVSADSGAKAFAGTADAAIRTYRAAEPRWSSFERRPYCAEPTFNPDSNALKLKKGDNKQLGVFARAKDGGQASEARWTLLNAENANFSPTSSEAAAPSISYTVTNAPEGGFVKVTAKVISTAGVGEKIWTQPTEASSLDEIEGTYGGELRGETPLGEPSVQQWSGSVKFHRLAVFEGEEFFTVTAGDVSITLSGIDGSGLTGCHQSGSTQAPLEGGGMTVTPVGPEGGPPYEYDIQLTMPYMSVKGTRVASCPKAAQEAGYEGSSFDAFPAWRLNVEGQESADGLSFVGSREETISTATYKEYWTLHGKP